MSKFLILISALATLLLASTVMATAVSSNTTLPATSMTPTGNGTAVPTTTTAVPTTTAAPTPAPTFNLTFDAVRVDPNASFYPTTFANRFADYANIDASLVVAQISASNTSIVIITVMDVNSTVADVVKGNVANFTSGELAMLGVSSITPEGSNPSAAPEKKLPLAAIAGGAAAGAVLLLVVLFIIRKKTSGGSGSREVGTSDTHRAFQHNELGASSNYKTQV